MDVQPRTALEQTYDLIATLEAPLTCCSAVVIMPCEISIESVLQYARKDSATARNEDESSPQIALAHTCP